MNIYLLLAANPHLARLAIVITSIICAEQVRQLAIAESVA